jgi:hypothetical protein
LRLGSGEHNVQDLEPMIRVPSGLNWENVTYVSHRNGLKMGVPPQRARRLSRATSSLDLIELHHAQLQTHVTVSDMVKQDKMRLLFFIYTTVDLWSGIYLPLGRL